MTLLELFLVYVYFSLPIGYPSNPRPRGARPSNHRPFNQRFTNHGSSIHGLSNYRPFNPGLSTPAIQPEAIYSQAAQSEVYQTQAIQSQDAMFGIFRIVFSVFSSNLVKVKRFKVLSFQPHLFYPVSLVTVLEVCGSVIHCVILSAVAYLFVLWLWVTVNLLISLRSR